MKIILLNGPPRSGKDTAFEALQERYSYPIIRRAKFADELKRMVHRAHHLPEDPDAFEARKDEPLPEFHGATPRQAYIRFSEDYAKPLFGDDYFGRLLIPALTKFRAEHVNLVVVTDSGFLAEAVPVIEAFPGDVSQVRLYREGTSFAGDSRRYWEHPDCQSFTLRNDDTPQDLANRIPI